MFSYRYDPYPPYGSRRRLISPMYDEYGEAIMDDDGYYYGAYGSEVTLVIFITGRSNVNKIQLFINKFLYHAYELY